MSNNPNLIPVETWKRAVDYLVYRVRAMLPGASLTGTVSAAGTNVITGLGTAFLSEVETGDWVRFVGAPGEAFVVQSVDSDTQITVDRAVTLAGSAASKNVEEIHRQTWRSEQNDRKARVSVDTVNVERYPEDRQVMFQILITDDEDIKAHQFANLFQAIFPEMGGFDLRPPPGFSDPIHVTWLREVSFVPVGQDTLGRHNYSINYVAEGGE